jgi:hypothetical protein
MSDLKSKMIRLFLAVIPGLVLTVIVNTIIASTVAGMVLIQLLSHDVNRSVALGIAVLVAIGVHCYIAWNHKIWELIKNTRKQNNE